MPPEEPLPSGGPPGGAGRIEVGFFSFTEVTDPGGHRAYNEWHQLDHLPEQYQLPGVVWGQRWVRTPACAAASRADPPFDAVHYVTCYLMGAPVEETLADFAALGAEMRRLDRFYPHRRAHRSGPFTVTGAHAAPSCVVSAGVVPFRPALGVYVVLWDRPPEAGPGPGAPGPAGALLDGLLDVPGVVGVWEFATRPAAARVARGVAGHAVTLCYLDHPPCSVAPALEEVVARHAAASGAGPLLAGPLETITPWRWDWFEPGTP